MITDYFSKVNNGTLAEPAQLAAPKTTVDTTASLSLATGWPVDATDGPIHIAIFKTGTDDTVTDGTVTYWKATLAGTTLSDMDLRGGVNQNYTTGDSVVILSPYQFNDLVEGILEEHNQDGTHDSALVAMLAGTQTFTGQKTFNAIKFNTPQGYLINGKIARTVSSNNITVALKTLSGDDPSASSPVFVRIGDTIRTVTAALSVTKNAGTNWMDLGSAQHATQDVDVFVYLGYNATDGVVIGFSRIPYARIYSNFSTTTTNEKYAAISTITNAASTDEYEVIGRVNVTLSATASFNWSVPGTSVIVNRPIFETRWLSWAPVFTNFTGTINVAKYKVTSDVCKLYTKITQGASVTGQHTFTLPIEINASQAITTPVNPVLAGFILDLGTAQFQAQGQLISSTTIGLIVQNSAGTYGQASATSGTIPMTWVNGNDAFYLFGDYATV